ncbi:hypothetical protein BC940DRAFT_314197 [Gongronella butleri]|nr:hypothetical protein BC940DRAFT_314197 [Gongronella butleri]
MSTDNVLKKAALGVGGVLGSMYLDSKYNVAGDISTVFRAVRVRRAVRGMQQRGELHTYYRFKEKAKATPKRVFLEFEGQKFTFEQVERESNRLANWLLSQGVQPQEHVAMMHQNHPTFVISWLAILKINAVAAFINHNLNGDALKHCVDVAKCKMLLFDPVYQEQVETIVGKEGNLRFVAYGEATQTGATNDVPFATTLTPDTLAQCSDADTPDALTRNATYDDNAMLIYTSGTTGLPKAAAIRHSRCAIGSVGFCLTMGLNATDRMFTVLPLYHSSASLIATLAPLYGGCTVILSRRFRASRFWDEIVQADATAFVYIGELCRYLLSQPERPAETQHRLRLICGNGMRPDVWNRFRERFHIPTIVEFYASTEGPGGFFNINKSEFGSGAVARIGPLLRAISPGVMVKVDPVTEFPERNAKGFLVPCKPGEEGELIVCLDTTGNDDVGLARFDGYYGNKAATNKKLISDAFKKGDLYYRTGDLLRLNQDGHVYFVDRIGDTFRWKSENVATTEVAHAASIFPGIQEANVYGTLVPLHDGRAGMAAIVLDNPSSFDFKGYAKHLKEQLPSYAVPQFLRIVPAMEITGTFKQQKVQFRNQGIDLAKVPTDHPLYWLKNDEYVPFKQEDLDAINAGKAKL